MEAADVRDVRRSRRIGGPGCARPELPTDAQPHPRHLRSGALAEDLRHARHDVLGRVRATDAGGELREDLVGVRTLAVDDAVGEAAGARADRLERQRQDDGRDHGDGGVVSTEQEAPRGHDRGVDRCHEDRERSRDHRLPDDDVEVVQAEPEDGDADGDGEREEARSAHHGRQDPVTGEDEVADEDRDEGESEPEHDPPDLLALGPGGPSEPHDERAHGHEEDHREEHGDHDVEVGQMRRGLDEEGVGDPEVHVRPGERPLSDDERDPDHGQEREDEHEVRSPSS